MNNWIVDLKKTTTLEGMNSKLSDTEKKCIGDLEDRTKEIIQLEQAERKKNYNESNLIDLYDNIKHYNIGIIGDSERGEREADKKCIWGHYG